MIYVVKDSSTHAHTTSSQSCNTCCPPVTGFVFTQAIASSVWIIIHDLGKFPSCTIVDSAGDSVEGDINYVSNTQLTVSFSAPFSGKAFLN